MKMRSIRLHKLGIIIGLIGVTEIVWWIIYTHDTMSTPATALLIFIYGLPLLIGTLLSFKSQVVVGILLAALSLFWFIWFCITSYISDQSIVFSRIVIEIFLPFSLPYLLTGTLFLFSRKTQ